MTSNIAVNITAQTSDLTAKLALAQSNVKAFGRATNDAANDIRESGRASDEQRAALERAAQGFASAKREAAGYSAELKKVNSEGGVGLKHVGEQIEGMVSPLTNVTGLASKLGEIFAVGFGIERLVEGVEKIAELGEQLEKTHKITGVAVETLSGWNYAANQMGLQAGLLDESLPKLGRSIQLALTNPASLAGRAFQAMGISQEYLRAHSNDLVPILMRMADAFHEHADGANADAIAMALIRGSGVQLIPLLREGSERLKELADENRKLGAEMSGPTAEAMEKHRQSVKQMDAAWSGLWLKLSTDVIPTMTNLAKVLAQGLSGNFHDAVVTDYTGQLEQLQTELKAVQKKAGEDSGLSKWWDERQIKGLEFQIDIVKAKLASLGAVPKPAVPGVAEHGEDHGHESSTEHGGTTHGEPKPQFGDLPEAISQIEQFRAKLAQVRADMTEAGASNTAILTREVAMWKEETTAAGLSGKERQQVEISYNNARTQLATASQAEQLATIRAATDAARLGTHERVELAQQEVAATIRIKGQGSTQAIEAEKRLTEAVRAESLQRIHVQEKGINDEITAIGKALDAQIRADDSLVRVHKISIDQRTADLVAANEAAKNSQLALIDQELAALQAANLTTTTEYKAADDRRTEILREGETKRQAILDKSAELQFAQNERDARAWEQSFQPITSAFDSMMGDMMQGRGTLHQQLIGFASKWVQSELAADAHMLLSKLALFTAEKLGFISKEAVEKATAAGTKGGLLGMIWETLAGKTSADATDVASTISTEAAKTSAVAAGSAVRSATALEESIAGRAASKAAGSTSIMNDAYKAAAGAYASAADIPFVGWIIAPVAAAAAFTAVAAYDVLSAEGGMSIPTGVNPFVQLHEKEMVLPAGIATPLRAMISDRGIAPAARAAAPIAAAGGSGGDNFHITVQAIDTKSGAQFLHNNARTIVAALRAQVRGGAPMPAF